MLNSNRGIMSQEEFEDNYQIKTHFLEHGRVKMIIKEFLARKEMSLYDKLNRQNSMINIILSLDRKGVSNIYKGMHGRSSHILFHICEK